MIAPMSSSAVRSFCTSNRYKDPDRIPARKVQDPNAIQDEQATPFLDVGELLVAPNPARDQINLLLPQDAGKVNIAIFDMQGKLVMTSAGAGQKVNVGISQLIKGMYVVRATNDAGQWTSKVMVE